MLGSARILTIFRRGVAGDRTLTTQTRQFYFENLKLESKAFYVFFSALLFALLLRFLNIRNNKKLKCQLKKYRF